MRSTPPVWMSNDATEVRHAHRRALDVPARPARAPAPCPRRARRAWRPSTARSRGRRPCRTRPPRRARRRASPPGQDGRAARRPATRRCGRRPSRPRWRRRGPSPGGRSTSSTIWGMCSVARGSTSGRVMPSASASARNRPAYRSASSVYGTPSAAAPRMILSSMSVRFMTHVTAKAAPAQVADQQVREQERAEVADVRRPVDGGPAAVDADVPGLQRLQRAGLARQACPAGGWS